MFHLTNDDHYFYLSFKDGYFKSTDGREWEKVIVDSPAFSCSAVVNENMFYGRKVFTRKMGQWEEVELEKNGYSEFPHYTHVFNGKAIPMGYKGGKNSFGLTEYPSFVETDDYPWHEFDKTVYELKGNHSDLPEVHPFNTFYSLSPYSNVVVAKGQKNHYWVSKDFGKSFTYFAGKKENINYFTLPYSPCGNGVLFATGVPKTSTTHSLFMSKDFGVSWENLIGFPKTYGNVLHLANGTTVLSSIGLFYISGHGCQGVANDPPIAEAPEVDYGTTVITHGMLTDDFFPEDGGWMDKMATAILTKANYGTVYFYKKETGEFVKLIESGSGVDRENIILFDWSDEALEFGNGSTEAAADALFAALITGNEKDLFGLKNLHFIGHGRGCIVNTLAVERIYQSFIPKIYGEQTVKEVSISQVTNLGPFDSGHNAWWEPGDINLNLLADDIDDAHPDIKILTPESNRSNNGVIAWRGIYSDSYWQNNGKIYLNNLLSALIPTKEKMGGQMINQLTGLMNASRNQVLIQQIKLIWKETISEQERSIKIRDLIDASLDELTNVKQIARKVKQLQFFLSLADIVYSNLKEREVEGSLNINWKEYDDKVVIHPTYKSKTMLPTEWVTDFIGICDAYIKSIEEAEYGQFDEDNGGFSISRLNGYDISPDLSSSSGNTNYLPNFDYFESLDIPGQSERVRGIMNGSFDRRISLDAPGWAFHGGGYTDYPDAVLFHQGYASLTDFYHFTEPVFLRHNRFYIPNNANSITFKASNSQFGYCPQNLSRIAKLAG